MIYFLWILTHNIWIYKFNKIKINTLTLLYIKYPSVSYFYYKVIGGITTLFDIYIYEKMKKPSFLLVGI